MTGLMTPISAQQRITLRDYANAHEREQIEPCLMRRHLYQANELDR
jgi:hypothetical protein